MKPASRTFEIGYSPSWELLDHSEVFLDGVPGSRSFLNLLPTIKAAVPAEAFAGVEQEMALLPRIEQWVQQDAAKEEIEIGGAHFTLKWERPAERIGIFSIHAAQEIASSTLLLCRDDERDVKETPLARMQELTAFTTALSRFIGDENAHDMQKFQLIEMTRRPLMASMFWPPYSPTNDTTVRTIQLQFAYAFFRANGEIAS